MTLKDSFCPSPWLHMRITNDGRYEYCRWAVKNNPAPESIRTHTPAEFFQTAMIPIRQALLDGKMPAGCAECCHMEQHGKVSGRQRQLLKIGVQLNQFEKTLASSPWVAEFANGPGTTQLPQDWQIDLGNYCNSGCVYCSPRSSSRLASEHLKLGLISQLPPSNWTDDPVLVDRFIDTLKSSPHIQYLHFIGGETVITPAFKIILEALIQAGLNRTATIGFTTNLTVWRDDVVELLTEFEGVNVGLSIESFTLANDYARWPITSATAKLNVERWIEKSQEQGWLVQLRTTPTILTVADLLTVYEYAWDKNISVESCNFFSEPAFLRPAVLPPARRQAIIDRMQSWIAQRQTTDQQIINTRDPNVVQQQIVQDLQSYIAYLRDEGDQSWRLPALVSYLKRLESSRGITVLDYIPEYEDLLRSAGY